MADIRILSKNHVHCRVDADVGIMQELSDYFTFEQPGARFMPQYRAKLWDGKVRLYSMFTQELYAGLIPYVGAFAALNNYTVENTIAAEADPYLDVGQYLEDLKLTGHGKPIDIRDYQIDACIPILKYRRSISEIATSAGKTLIIFMIFGYLYDRKKAGKFLMIVPNTNLIIQTIEDFEEYNLGKLRFLTQMLHGGTDKTKQNV